MLKQNYPRRPNAARAIVAALLFTFVLLTTTILPHRHAGERFGASAHSKAVGIQQASTACPLCDWLASPRMQAPPSVVITILRTVLRGLPRPETTQCRLTDAEPLHTPQRGPPTRILFVLA